MTEPDHSQVELTFAAPGCLANVTVVLVEPAEPGNIGAVARAMRTMGLTDLVVWNGPPQPLTSYAEARMMAHGARDLLESARIVSTWDEATAGLHWLVGTTHRKRRMQFAQVEDVHHAAVKVIELSQHPNQRVGILFGREQSGLNDEELRRCQTLATIPSATAHPSLNLAQAVMVFAAEIFRASLGAVPVPQPELASVHEIESVIDHLRRSLGGIGFVPHQSDSDTFMRAVRRVLSRAPLEQRDCRVIHRICQQIDYYVRRHP